MAIIFMTGFDADTGGYNGNTLTGTIARRWTDVVIQTNLNAALTSASPRSRQAIRATSNGGCLRKAFATNYTGTGIIGFALYTEAGPASRSLFYVLDGTSEQISIRTDSSARLIVSRAGTTIATGTTVLTQGAWYYIELQFVIDPTAGSVTLRLNGATEASASNVNTRNTANSQWNGVGPFLTSGFSTVDDIYVLDASTGANTSFLGPVSIVPLYPSGAGSSTQWTSNGGANFAAVGEITPDDDATFVASSTANAIDLYAMDDVPASTGTVYAVQHVINARQDTGATRSIAPVTRIGSTNYVGTAVNLSTGYQAIVQIYNQSPATSSAWTITEVNGLEAGVKLVS
jgi:hypothetical protein